MSENTDNFLLLDGEKPEDKLNTIFRRLYDNDLAIYGNFKKIPGLWFCKWFNNNRIKGYSSGDFFWLNTEDIQQFINDNHKQIRELANVNPFLKEKLPVWKNNDEEIFNQYYNVLTGYINPEEMSAPLSALYELGNLSNNFQIVVSQKDNNKDPIENKESWKRFAVNTEEDYDNIVFTTNQIIPSILNRHIEMFHFGGENYTQQQLLDLSANYANEDFSNVSFSFPQNYLRSNYHVHGFDCVDVYVRKPYANKLDNGMMTEETWFRKWKSGFLEHGGIINVENYLNVYKDLVIVPFRWKFVDNASKYYTTDYIGLNGHPIEIDESGMIPPGDNLISVLHELDNLIIDNSEYSPSYYSNEYTVSLVPIQQQFNVDQSIGSIESYDQLGNWDINANVLNVTLDREKCTEKQFAFKYDSRNTPKYYCYYVTGFCQ